MGVGCCTIFFLMFDIAAIVSGTIFVIRDKGEMDFPYHLWWWSVIAIGYIFVSFIWYIVREILFCTGHLMKPEDPGEDAPKADKMKYFVRTHIIDYTNAMDSALWITFLGLFIWGLQVFVSLEQNPNPYSHELWTWFLAVYWILSGIFALMLAIAGCLCCCICVGGGTAGIVLCVSECKDGHCCCC
jgi:hypothetical protein